MSEKIARLFHDTYERLAPSFGYETRTDTKTFDPTSANGQLMIAVTSEVQQFIVDDFLAKVRALEPLLYQAEFDKADFDEKDSVEWDYFEEAIQQVYAEMFPEEVK